MTLAPKVWSRTLTFSYFAMLVWVRRNKGKLLLACILVAGGYVGGRYVLQSKVSEWRRSIGGKKRREVDLARLKEHIESNRQTCQATILGFLPNMREVVLEQLDAEAITDQLRAKPANKVALWENLKVISFARLVSSVYACALLSALLRVQLSITGGQMFCEVHSQQGPHTEIHKEFLSHLLQQGLHMLMGSIREAAHSILISYSLKHQLSCDGVLQLLSDIRQQLVVQLAPSRSEKNRCFLVDYLLPKDSLLSSQPKLQLQPQNDALMSEQAQLAATRDILECAEFSETLEVCVSEAFRHLSHSLTEAYHSAAQSEPTLALAKVIPLVTDHGQLILSGHTHFNVITQLMANEQLQKLSQNVYEAFAHT